MAAPTLQTQRLTYIAIAQHHVDQVQQLADLQSAQIAFQAGTEASESLGIATARQAAAYQVATAENLASISTANIRSGGDIAESNYRSQVDLITAGYRVNNIEAETRYSVATIQGEARAQIRGIASEAGIRAATTTTVSTSQQATITGEAAIDALRYAALAQVQITEIRSRATLDRASELAIANVQSDTIRSEADIAASATTQISTIEAGEVSAEAGIRSANEAAIATLQVSYIDADARNQVRVTLGTSSVRAKGDRDSSDLRAASTRERADVEAQSIIDIALARAGLDIYTATQRGLGVRYAALREYEASVFTSDRQSELVRYRADSQYSSTVSTSDTSKQARQYSADRDSLRTTETATIDASASEDVADIDYTAVVYREDSDTDILRARLAFEKGGWDTVLPVWRQTTTPPSTPSTPGYQRSRPFVSRRVAATRSQTDRKLNSAWSKASASGAARFRSATNDVAGRGCGTASPAVEAKRMSTAAEVLEEQGKAWGDAWTEAFAGNADALLAAQSAYAESVATANAQALAAEKAWNQRNVGLLEKAVSIVS